MVSGPLPPPVEPPPPPPAAPPTAPGRRRRFDPLTIAVLVVAAVLVGSGIAYLMSRSSEPSASRPADAGTTTTAAGTPTSTTTTTTDTTPETTTTTAMTTTSTTEAPTPTGDVSAEGSWTVLVYAVGDNNLEDALLGDMREMKLVTRDTPDLTFVVLADRSAEITDAGLGSLGDWTSAKLIEVTGNSFKELDDWGEQNMGEADVLARLVTEGSAAVPADHYALVFWDHGSMTGIGPDDSAGDVLEAWEIAVGLETGLTASGITIDFIGFDACLMASLEIVSLVAPYATYMIASEEYEPNDGWEYGGFGYVGSDGATVVGLGRSLLQAYLDTSGAGDPSVTLSMLDLRRYDEFAAALGTFAETALDTIDTSAVAIGRRRDKAVKFGSDPDPLKDWFMVDLGQVLSRLARTDVPVADDAQRAADLLDEIVVANMTGEASAGARGLSIHFPPSPDTYYPTWYQAFGDPVWADFLDGYFAAGRAIPPSRRAAVVDTSPQTTFFFDDYGLEIDAEIQPGSLDTVVSAVLWSGIPEDDGGVTFYSSDQGIVEGMLAVGFYDLTQLVLSDGQDSAIAFQQLAINEDLTIVTMTVPLAYKAPIDPANFVWDDPIDVTLKVTYNVETEEFTEELFATNLGTVGAFTAEPNGLFFPVVPYQAPGGEIEWIVTSDVGLWSDLPIITYEFVDLASGTPLYGELTIADFGGNTATVSVTTEVP
ncbi:MAG: clostripain-related cysteine peptidase [Actinomycetota bacterium]